MCYAELDIVSFDGNAYIARSDNPGIVPCDGWELIIDQQAGQARPSRGKRQKGAKGDKGDDAQEIRHIDPVSYRAIPFMSNGQPGAALEPRDLFLRFLEEWGTDTATNMRQRERLSPDVRFRRQRLAIAKAAMDRALVRSVATYELVVSRLASQRRLGCFSRRRLL